MHVQISSDQRLFGATGRIKEHGEMIQEVVLTAIVREGSLLFK